MKNLKAIFLVVFSSLIITGCFSDQGNYDYESLSTITVSDIAESYTCVQLVDTLTITPTIDASEPTDEIAYLWTIAKYQDLLSEEENLPIDTLSTECNLVLPVELTAGEYRLMYTVTNLTNSGLEVFAQAKLTVKTEFSEGFYLLKETATGMTELDLYTSENEFFEDLFEETGTGSLEGAPIGFGLFKEFSYLDSDSGEYVYDHMLCPVTDAGKTGMYKNKDLTLFRDYENMFFGDCPTAKPLKMMHLFATIFVCITEDGEYFTRNDKGGYPSIGYFGYLQSFGGSYDYIISEDLAYTGYSAFFVDLATNNLMYMNYNTGALTQATTLLASQQSVKAMEGEYVYMTSAGSKLATNVIIMNNEEEGCYQLYIFAPYSTSSAYVTCSRTDIDTSSEIYNAEMITANKYTASLLYLKDAANKFYTFSLTDFSTKEITLSGLPEGEEVTLMQNMYCTLGDYPFDHFVVATTDGENYTVLMYDMIGGEPVGEPVKTIKGSGIVRKMQYTSPDVIYTSGGTYNISLHY